MQKDTFEPSPTSENKSERQPPLISDPFISKLTAMVSRNPRVRKLVSSKGLKYSASNEVVDEIVQEILVRILSSESIVGIDENRLLSRIRKIELPQLLNESLRREVPERFRISKRIWKIVSKSPRFSLTPSTSRVPPIYDGSTLIGLSEWTAIREVNIDSLSRRQVEIPTREFRRVGRYQTSQLVITNTQLENYLIQILESAGGHLPLNRLRGIALSGINLCDPGFESLEKIEECGELPESGTTSKNPHEELIHREQLDRLPEKEREFLQKVRDRCDSNDQRFRRVIGVLWFCVLSNPPLMKRRAANALGISASLVSRDISLIREVCRSLELEDEELKFLLKERLEKSLEGLMPD